MILNIYTLMQMFRNYKKKRCSPKRCSTTRWKE